MAVLVINRGSDAVSVDIIDSKGRKNAVNLQGRGKVTLPEGCSVVKNFLARNPQIIVKEK